MKNALFLILVFQSCLSFGQNYQNYDWRLTERVLAAKENHMEAVVCLPAEEERNNLYIMYKPGHGTWVSGQWCKDTLTLRAVFIERLSNAKRNNRWPESLAKAVVIADIDTSGLPQMLLPELLALFQPVGNALASARRVVLQMESARVYQRSSDDLSVEEWNSLAGDCQTHLFPAFAAEMLEPRAAIAGETVLAYEVEAPMVSARNTLNPEVFADGRWVYRSVSYDEAGFRKLIRTFVTNPEQSAEWPAQVEITEPRCQQKLLALNRSLRGSTTDERGSLLAERGLWVSRMEAVKLLGNFYTVAQPIQYVFQSAAEDSLGLNKLTREILVAEMEGLREALCQERFKISLKDLDLSNSDDQAKYHAIRVALPYWF